MRGVPSPIDRYLNAARTGRHHWWHWILGIVFVIALYLAGTYALYTLIYAGVDMFRPEGAISVTAYEMVDYLGLITSFLPLFFATFLVHRYWHSRPITALLTYTSRFRWGHAARAAFTTFAVYAVATPILFIFDPEVLTRISDWRLYAVGLGMTLLFIPFQAAAEEIAVRGYLNQALIKYLKYPWVIFLLTSAFFGWLHASNPEAEGQMLTYMMSITGFGLLMCVLLYFEGGLESAIGVHIANNIFVFAIVGYEDPTLPELAIWSTGPPEITFGGSLLELSIVALTVAIVLFWNKQADKKNLAEERIF